MELQSQFKRSTRAFVRSGGKANRRMQIKRMERFIAHCRRLGVTRMEHIGKRHIMSYYQEIDHFSESTKLNHYYAIRLLLRLNFLPEPIKPSDPLLKAPKTMSHQAT